MKILAVETSCDETAVAVLETKNYLENKSRKELSSFGYKILSNIVASQIKLHSVCGGVVPNLARREHQYNLIPVLIKALKQSKLLKNSKLKAQSSPKESLWLSTGQAKPQLKVQNLKSKKLQAILERESELLTQTLEFLEKYQKPDIDLIAVTQGPGLEPCLWVGINFAKALAYVWGIPLIGINHMEGHLFSVFLQKKQKRKKSKSEILNSKQTQNSKFKIPKIEFPAIALLVSGGHTELVLIGDWLKYKVIGETRDDAAGEAFDKAARLLGLGYPGGPAIAAEATKFPTSNFHLPRPMINSKDYDFSFSGLKTAVLYLIQNLKKNKQDIKNFIPEIAREFQQAVIDVLIAKTIRAAKDYKAKTIILAGGVAANKELRKQMKKAVQKHFLTTDYRLPTTAFCGDNAAMIALAAFFQTQKNPPRKNSWRIIKAQGNLTLSLK